MWWSLFQMNTEWHICPKSCILFFFSFRSFMKFLTIIFLVLIFSAIVLAIPLSLVPFPNFISTFCLQRSHEGTALSPRWPPLWITTIHSSIYNVVATFAAILSYIKIWNSFLARLWECHLKQHQSLIKIKVNNFYQKSLFLSHNNNKKGWFNTIFSLPPPNFPFTY